MVSKRVTWPILLGVLGDVLELGISTDQAKVEGIIGNFDERCLTPGYQSRWPRDANLGLSGSIG